MDLIRKILFPFSYLYGEIVGLRNIAYDRGWFDSRSFDFPVIVVGNLNVGGTGKSPQIEYLVRLLEKDYKIAILSRGYRRKSTGFQLANNNSTADEIGDEPLQFYKKFKNLLVAVDADRVNGITQLKNLDLAPEIILLDDAFQHRKVKAGLNILLSSYGDLFVDDYMLPTGFLREKKAGANRADLIIVTKCPGNLSNKKKTEIIHKLSVNKNQSVFFSTITYSESVISNENRIDISNLKEYNILLITGIANSQPLINFLKSKNIQFKHLKYADHHNFTPSEKVKIFNDFDKIKADKKILLTTEKDFVRTFSKDKGSIYYIPIQSQFIENGGDFNEYILKYIRSSKRNG